MGNAQAVKQHAQTAEKTGVFVIKGQKLKEVPEALKRLAGSLRTIDLSVNSIPALPTWIGDFGALKSLTVNHNQLDEVGNLKKLETFACAENGLQFLPESFSRLTTLKYVHLPGNQLNEFPVVLCSLPNLEVVDLSKNRIRRISGEVSGLRAHELNLNQNQISILSEEISRCPRLKVLRLEENCIPAKGISPKILKESQISLLTLDGNIFQMKELQYLDGYEQYMERYTASKRKL